MNDLRSPLVPSLGAADEFVVRRFSSAIGMIGDSNCVGAANYNATGQADTGYGVSNSSGYAPVTMRSFYATGVADPLTIVDTGSVTLRAYDIPGNLNMGMEQTLARRLYQRGVSAAPLIWKWGVSGSVQHTNWRADSTSPITGGNMVAQVVAFFLAREAEFNRKLDCIVVNLGENDTSSSTNATPTATDIASMVSGIRTGLSRPQLPFFYVLVNSTTTGAFTSTVRAGQVTAIAADQYMRGIYSDDIRLASNPHYGANGYYDLGDRAAHEIIKYFWPGVSFNLETPSAIPRLQDQGAMFTSAVSPATAAPRSGPDIADGDLQLLVVTSQSTDPTYTLTTAAGFAAVNAKFQSIFSGTNYRTMGVWWRLVDQTTLNANNGTMPNPVIDATVAATNGAVILTIRGPNKWVANPIDQLTTGANNANSTALSITGHTTAVANEMALILCSLPGSGSTVSACTNANLTGISKRRESTITQTTTIGLAVHTAQVPASGTVIGATSITMSGAGNNVGCIITIKP